MIPSLRTLLPVTATLALMLGSGCFWLEPIHAYPDPDPDSGILTDGGDPDAGNPDAGDGGETDGGVVCGPDAPVPANAQVVFEIASADRFLDEGDFAVTLNLNQAFDTPVWVRLGTSAPGAVAPFEDGLCFEAGSTSVEVDLAVLGIGFANVEARLANRTPAILAVSITERPVDPILTALSPAKAFVTASQVVPLTIQLSGPAWEPETVTFTVTGGLSSITPLVIPAGASSGTINVTMPSSYAPNVHAEDSVTATLSSGEGTASATFQSSGVVLSEILWNDTGFIELYNPTNKRVNVKDWVINAREHGNTGSATNLYQFSGDTHIQAHGYLLVGLWNFNGTPDYRTSDKSSLMGLTGFRVRLFKPKGGGGDVMDEVNFGGTGQHASPTVKSVERKAWGDAEAIDMAGGRYTSSGNGWDTGNDLDDWLVRDVPEPQVRSSTTESIE